MIFRGSLFERYSYQTRICMNLTLLRSRPLSIKSRISAVDSALKEEDGVTVVDIDVAVPTTYTAVRETQVNLRFAFYL